METKFQTSFIPKKTIPFSQPGSAMPSARKPAGGGGGSIFMTIAIVLFVLSVLSIGGAYLWKAYLLSAQNGYNSELSAKLKDINTDQIALIQAESTKIGLARQLLSSHLAISSIFSILSSLTAESVRYLSMDLTIPSGASTPMQLSISGYGQNLPTVAFQSDVLNHLDKYGVKNVVKNAIISNPAINQNGTVSFGFTAQIDPSSFSYAKTVQGSAPSK